MTSRRLVRRAPKGSSVRGVGGRSGTGRLEPASDRLERGTERVATRWDATLLWFMRVVALAWIAKGLLSWALIVGALPDVAPFEAERLGRQTAVAYFGVVDLLAAVGLWLATPWGGVIWLLAATSYLVLGIVLPAIVPVTVPLLAVGAGLIMTYLALSSLAAREVR